MKKHEKLLIQRNEGMTLTEMLIVIALIGLLGTYVASKVIEKYNQAKVDFSKSQMRTVSAALDQFRMNCNFYPETDQGLEALVSKPEVGRECKSYPSEGYIKSVPKDGFGNRYHYESDGQNFVIKSLGADEKEGGEGLDADISSQDLDK